MPNGDVIIEPDGATITGQRLNCQTWDFWLDAKDRRIDQSGVRRALVHDFNDRLTLNYAHDYPNGVQILGNVVVDSLFVRGWAGFATTVVAPDLMLTKASEPPMKVPGVSVHKMSEEHAQVLQKVIQGFQSQIQDLQARIAKLEGK